MKTVFKKVTVGFKRMEERGAALVTALVFLLILTMLGVAAVMTSDTEIMISRNDRLNKLALNYANAGAQAATCLLDNGQRGTNDRSRNISVSDVTNLSWTVRPGDVGMSGTGMNFLVTIKYKAEDSLHHNLNGVNGEVVGYCKEDQYTKAPYTSFNSSLPVYEITSEGWVGDAAGTNKQADAIVVVDVTKNTINIDAVGGFWGGECPTLNGGPAVTPCPGTNSIALNSGVTACTTTGSDWNNIGAPRSGATSTFVNMTTYLGMNLREVSALADEKPNITVNTTLTDVNYGDYLTNNPKIIYTTVQSPANYVLNGLTGYGLLVVVGDVQITGNCNWYGMIYVKGNLTFGGGGASGINIHGAVMADGNVSTLSGSTNIDCNQTVLDGIGQKAFKTKMINWKRDYNSS